MKYHNIDDTIKELIANDSFFLWSLFPTPESEKEWRQWLEENPDKEACMLEAKKIIQSARLNEDSLPAEDFQALNKRITHSLNIQTKEKESDSHRPFLKHALLPRIAAVAAVALVLVASVVFYIYTTGTEKSDFDLISKLLDELDSENIDETTLVLAQEKLLVEENTTIVFNEKGELKVSPKAIDKNNIDKQDTTTTDSPKAEILDQLIVPKGRRAHIILSDGTALWVNSGSKVLFPRVFSDKSRKIYVQGEAYMEVCKSEVPFIVSTADFEVRVLGTKFNVSNYKEMELSRIVLVDGSVDVVDTHKQSMRMIPNELIAVQQGSILEKQTVNAEEYISWINGLLILHGEALDAVIHKLNNYYGKNITCDSALKEMKIYGKLDMKENFNDVLDCIETIIPVRVIEENGDLFIKAK